MFGFLNQLVYENLFLKRWKTNFRSDQIRSEQIGLLLAFFFLSLYLNLQSV